MPPSGDLLHYKHFLAAAAVKFLIAILKPPVFLGSKFIFANFCVKRELDDLCFSFSSNLSL